MTAVTAMTFDDLRRILIECAGGADLFEEFGQALAGDIVDESFEELGYDSLALIESAALIKRQFGVSIPDDEITEVETPRELLDLVNAVLPGKTTAAVTAVTAASAAAA